MTQKRLNWRQVLAKKMGLEERLFTVLFGLLIIVAMSTMILLLNGLNTAQVEKVKKASDPWEIYKSLKPSADHPEETLDEPDEHSVAPEGIVVNTSFATSAESEAENGGMEEAVKEGLVKVRSGEMNYPQFISHLAAAGVTGYTAEVASYRIVFHGKGGQTILEAGVPVVDSRQNPGRFSQGGIQAAIEDAQKMRIDHPTFLKRIYDSGITVYDVDTLKRRIVYKGAGGSYTEAIPDVTAGPSLS